MATVFKTFLNDDIATTRTLLHEAVPVSGGIVDGTAYSESNAAETNIKNYTHEMFQSVYDYSYTKSSSNHIFDVTVGVNGATAGTGNDYFYAAGDTTAAKKQIIYNQFAQILAGHDTSGNIRAFDADGDFTGAGGTKHIQCYVISIARLLNKDEIKKGSFYMKLNVQKQSTHGGADTDKTGGARQELLISDEGSADDYKVNSPAGDYGILKCRTYKHYEGNWAGGVFTQTSSNEVYTLDYDPTDATTGYVSEDLADTGNAAIDINAGLIFYQAGVVVLNPHIFSKYGGAVDAPTAVSPLGKLPTGITATDSNALNIQPGTPEIAATAAHGTATLDVSDSFQQVSIPLNCDGLRKRIHQIAFNNTTELNSTIYFCRVNHNDFNYSSNPTYLNDGQIRVKQTLTDAPISYITSVGLYSANNELLAVAKLSEPLRKDPTNEMVLRVRLDY